MPGFTEDMKNVAPAKVLYELGVNREEDRPTENAKKAEIKNVAVNGEILPVMEAKNRNCEISGEMTREIMKEQEELISRLQWCLQKIQDMFADARASTSEFSQNVQGSAAVVDKNFAGSTGASAVLAPLTAVRPIKNFSYARFLIPNHPNTITVMANQKYEAFINMIADIALKRGIEVDGKEPVGSHGNSRGILKTVIHNTEQRPEIVAKVDGQSISDFASVCRILGMVLGLYPCGEDYLTASIECESWLLSADALFTGLVSIDRVVRAANRMLSASDFLLGKYVGVSIADVAVFCSFKYAAEDGYVYANNVELWFRDRKSVV